MQNFKVEIDWSAFPINLFCSKQQYVPYKAKLNIMHVYGQMLKTSAAWNTWRRQKQSVTDQRQRQIDRQIDTVIPM